jgi:sec-independent protein translocase protein TatA
MGLGGISLPQLLIILAIVLLVFGTKRMKSIGSDLGGAIRGFRKAMEAQDDKGGNHADTEAQQPRIAGANAEPKAQMSERTDDALGG